MYALEHENGSCWMGSHLSGINSMRIYFCKDFAEEVKQKVEAELGLV